MTSEVTGEAGLRAGGREWAGLAVLALPTVLLALDNTVLFLALPHLSADLAATPVQQLWIMDGYGFLIAGFLVTMGSLGDRIGRRRLLLIGAAAFGAVSVVAAYAPSAELLVAARMLLGVAGATLMPSALALIRLMFRDARQRGLAVGVFVSCFMGGGAIGPLVGGVLLEHFWWGSVFLAGVPVMVLLLGAAPFVLPADRGSGAGRPDLGSVALSLGAVLLTVYGLKELAGGEGHWPALLAVPAGVALGYTFVRRQRRLADPLLDLRLFGDRLFGAALVILLLAMALQGGSYLLAGQYLQLVEGLSPLRAGLWLVPPALALAAGSLAAPLLARRFGPAVVIAAGMAVSAGGFALLTQVEPAGGPGLLTAGLVIAFLGAAPVGALGIDLIVGSAPPDKAGSASSVSETSGELGIALGVALLGSVAAVVYRASAATGLPGAAPDAARESLPGAAAAAADLPPGAALDLLAAAAGAFTSGLHVVAGVAAAVSAGLGVLAVVALRRARTQPES
ncbi:DHA2 family multidrug resistance protein-like MFS transporter [Prauserella shujinwangii]|uniref:DHA2 family multidrug resistance protein-like MFS transporter n=2 Tax=Prauserella shujinwangii TaxID=1453103 RepID=A0A2T0LRS8_9PSEU|nr:MFS transporter [Prauserella shujinwangii]PRX46162.1 DHA2 family multidrug resistance protein-like MFS transporter [Prauserella shujinwangii]